MILLQPRPYRTPKPVGIVLPASLREPSNIMSTWPRFDDDEIQAVERVLRSGQVNYWTGNECTQFEREYAQHCNVSYAVAVANASVGLELALYALGIGPGDEVIVPARTFVATASSVALRGATPVFADVDAQSQNLTVSTVADAITARTRAIIAVHLAGWPCDMESITSLARERNLKVIEDCAQAHGARYRGQPVGSFGDIGVFSFCQDKIITTGGEGGMLVTNDSEAWQRAWSHKDHGKSFAAFHGHPQLPQTGFRWVHESFGTNWRLTETQAAIGRIQLRKLPAWVDSRRRNAAILTENLRTLTALRIPEPPPRVFHSYYKYYAFLDSGRLRHDWSRDRIIETLNERGVSCFSGSCSEVYREQAFQRAGFTPRERLPVARLLGDTSLMLQVDQTVGPQDLTRACEAITNVVHAATSD